MIGINTLPNSLKRVLPPLAQMIHSSNGSGNKIKYIALPEIQKINSAVGSERQLPIITPRTREAQITVQIAEDLGLTSPNPAWGALQAGLEREAIGNEKIKQNSEKANSYLNLIDSLLDLQAALSENSQEVSEKAQGIANQLKENGIELLPENQSKISKEQLMEIKTNISHHIDKHKTKLHNLMTTEIQTEINNLQTIMNAIQQIIQLDARVKRHINDNSTK